MPKRYLTGGGKSPKNRNNSSGYLSKNFKNLKYFANKFLKKIRNLNKILTFGVYDRIGGAGPRAQKGSGAGVFGLFTYQTVCRKIPKIVSDAKRKPLDRCNSQKIPDATSRCRGSILIEFAVCMPILIILLFYIHDLIKIKRYYSQTEFIGQQMANILQNISKNQPVTLTNIKHASALAWLTIPPNSENLKAYTNIYYVSTEYLTWGPLGHPSLEAVVEVCPCESNRIYYVFTGATHSGSTATSTGKAIDLDNKSTAEICPDSIYDCSTFHFIRAYCSGSENCNLSQIETSYQQTDPGKAACAWGVGFQRNSNGTWTQDGGVISTKKTSSTVRWGCGQNVEPSAIYPTLRMNNESGKIIIETQFRLTSGSAKTAFGLRMVNPKPSTSSNNTFFSSVVIFQPKSGLFSVTAPQ